MVRHNCPCQGAPQAVETLGIGHGVPGGIVQSAHYRKLQGLIDIVELFDDTDPLRNY